MYITWKYDLFPYELCGKVIKCNSETEFYTVEGYDGMSFEAKRRIVDDNTGLRVKEMLENAAEDYRSELAALNEKYRKYVALRMAQYNGIK